MKLELKHLAPYLPYGLKGKAEQYDTVDKLLGIYGTNGHTLTLCHQVNNHNTIDYAVDINNFKPILRPLSDLTKEIEVNGEKFVPYKKLYWGYCNGGAEFGNVVYCEYGESPKTAINVLDYIDDYFQLLQWHFDIFGLIKQGLAIDTNTLND